MAGIDKALPDVALTTTFVGADFLYVVRGGVSNRISGTNSALALAALGLATEDYVDAQVSAIDLSGYALTTYVDQEFVDHLAASDPHPLYALESALGTLSTQNSNNVSITGGAISGVTLSATNATLTTPNLGTPSAIALTNGTGLPLAGLSNLHANLVTPLASAPTGTGSVVLSASPTFTGTLTAAAGTFSTTLVLTSPNGANNNDFIAKITNNDTDGGQSNGLVVQAGNSSSDCAFAVKDRANTNLLRVYGDGTIGINTGVAAIPARFQIIATTEQFRLGYDATNYVSNTVSSGGDLTIAPSGGDTNITGTLAVSSTIKTGVFTVAGLPAGSTGDRAYASNGRKAGEGAGLGTGVPVFKDGTAWCAYDTGLAVAA